MDSTAVFGTACKSSSLFRGILTNIDYSIMFHAVRDVAQLAEHSVWDRAVARSSRVIPMRSKYGRVAEWPNARVCKTLKPPVQIRPRP